MSIELTPTILRNILSYDPETGYFRWRSSRGRFAPVGGRAGRPCANGYRRITIDAHDYYEHRLAWVYMTGAPPDKQIDHINGLRTDNRFANLRECDYRHNLANTPVKANSLTGIKGVTYRKDTGRWWARIRENGVRRTIGHYSTPEEAREAYAAAARALYGAFAYKD